MKSSAASNTTTTAKKEGQCKFYNRVKGFGFIKQTDGDEIFVHATGLLDEITKDDHVEFEVVEGKRGPTCINVKRI